MIIAQAGEFSQANPIHQALLDGHGIESVPEHVFYYQVAIYELAKELYDVLRRYIPGTTKTDMIIGLRWTDKTFSSSNP